MIIRFKNYIKHKKLLNESIKDDVINNIIDKIKNKKKLNKSEIYLLNNFDNVTDDYFKDYVYLSRNDVVDVLSKLIKDKRKIICNLHDRNGKYDLEIINIYKNYNEDKFYVIMKGNIKHELKDNFLYNIVYDINKDVYYLHEQDEYYEEILKDR